MQSLQNTHPDVFSKIFKFIPEYGYWKDLFKLNPTQELIEFIAETLTAESDHSLCAKYTPRKGVWFGKLRKELGMSLADFRHFLVKKTQVVEQQMCSQKWSKIDYSSVPSIAGMRYSEIFKRHDSDRYNNYLKDVAEGKSKINASVLYPGDVYNKACPGDCAYDGIVKDPELIRNLWNALPNYMQDCKEKILPICDTSGSMYSGMGKTRPIDVSVGLGVYIAEHNSGPFHNFFMTFSENPQCIQLTGNDVIDHFQQLNAKAWGYNTDLEKVFVCLLKQAKTFNLKQEDMPTKLLLISDMQFDAATGYGCNQNLTSFEKTNFEAIEEMYRAAGYERPGIVFWNVNGDAGNMPATLRDKNIAFISGYSPAIIESVMHGDFLDPMQVMFATINSERYNKIRL